MKADNVPLRQYLEPSNRIFIIPLYQRYYNWAEKQCERLFLDVIETIKNKNRHFLGAIVYKLGGDATYQEHILIDGQQRITSVSLLYLALYSIMAEYDNNYADYEILYKFIKNRNPKHENFKIKLQPIERDKKVYNELLLDLKRSQNSSNIYDNYLAFKKMIEESYYQVEDIFESISNLDIVYIELNENENPQKIFESLNSKGLKLSGGDLIRNYLLMGLIYDEQKRLYETYWEKLEENVGTNNIDDFVRCYLTIKTGQFPKKDFVYEEFKSYCEKDNLINNLIIEAILKSLYYYSIYYNWCLNKNSPFSNINSRIEVFHELRQGVVFSFLISIFYKFDRTKEVSEEETIKILDFLVSYVFRRIVCRKASNGLNKVIGNISHEYDVEHQKDYYIFVCQNIFSRKGSAAMPNNDEFMRDFINLEAKEPKYILENLEKYLNREPVNFKNIQLEHIMPRKLTSDWQKELGEEFKEIHNSFLNNIGNLTLTGYNQEMSNKTFDKKEDYFKDSSIKITKQLSDYKKWNKESILNRATYFFEIANKIWHYPEDIEPLEGVISGEEYSITDDVRVSGSKVKKIYIGNKEVSIKSWREMVIVLSEHAYTLDKEHFRINCGAGKILNFLDSTQIGRSKEILNSGFYLRYDYNAQVLLSFCKRICEVFQIEDDVSYILS
ncbi:MAG: DUF262 domain-containing HNH endonuclease family protein [Defluviitaleaceae bacterium]|nr:DUF262 domain-containing HNH endonuclease family protein [Defluviitaleaceae bacterium]